jgi:pimeloyl-ACP methyl ester carboxylesterase
VSSGRLGRLFGTALHYGTAAAGIATGVWWARRVARVAREARGAGVLRREMTPVGPHRIHVRVAAGPPHAADLPVVLVHGWGVGGRYLVPTAVRLAAGRPVYVPDLPGHGASSTPPAPLDVPALADVLVAWMDAAGLAAAVLLGNSLGCQIATAAAVRHPERVRALVLVGPTVDPAARSMARQALRFAACVPFERPALALLVAADYARMGVPRLRRELRHVLADRIEERLPRVAAPTLVVRGAHDALVPARWAREVARLLPDARLTTVRGAGHAVNHGAPHALAEAVRGFLRDRRVYSSP